VGNELLQQHAQEWQNIFGKLTSEEWLLSLRKHRWDAFLAQGFPTTKDEHWKYTSLQQFKSQPFKLGIKNHCEITHSELQPFYIDTDYRLVFVDGLFARDLSLLPVSQSHIIVSSLSKAMDMHSDVIQPYLQEQKIQNAFLNLNTACMQEGIFIFIPAQCRLEKPLHLLFISTTDAMGCMQNIRNIVIVDTHAKASIIEEYQCLTAQTSVTNAVTQIQVHEDATLDYIKLQNQNKSAFHISNTIITQKRNSLMRAYSYSVGSQLAREDIHCFLEENGASLQLHGLYLPLQQQHMDIHTYVYHCADHTSSEEFFKGIISNRSRAIFNGKITVAKQTHDTVANLQNKNLLLTPDSEVNTKPELEIYSNDVKCRHGATVGQLDQEMLFYLRSRGIPKEQAHHLLLLAFINENLTVILDPAIAEKICHAVTHYCEEKCYE
jgi:Fe-S cluster assembly protein SufD